MTYCKIDSSIVWSFIDDKSDMVSNLRDQFEGSNTVDLFALGYYQCLKDLIDYIKEIEDYRENNPIEENE